MTVPKPVRDQYRRQIATLPPVRQVPRMEGFTAGWEAAKAAGGPLTQQAMDAYAEDIRYRFTHQQPTLINGFKDGWAAALEAAE